MVTEFVSTPNSLGLLSGLVTLQPFSLNLISNVNMPYL